MSVYQYSPPAVGFAELSSFASTLATGTVPSPTIGAHTISTSKGSATSLLLRKGETGGVQTLVFALTVSLAFGGMSLV